MSTEESMEDLFPGCSNGRRLQVIRGAMGNHLRRVWEESQKDTSLIARKWAVHKMLHRQLQEMETNQETTGFAVTNHELSVAVEQEAFDPQCPQTRPMTHDWKQEGF